MKNILSLILAAVLLSNCHGLNESFKKSAVGNPYEVLVVCDEEFWNAPAGRAIFNALDTDIPGLPQSERSFRISRVSEANFTGMIKPFRNVITVDIDEHMYTKTSFKYSRDPFATPQMIMTIQSPNREDFEQYVNENKQVIVDFFTAAEMNRQIDILKEKHNETALATTKEMFDCELLIPAQLNGEKRGENFVWFSDFNSTNPDILSFVMYSYPYTSTDNFSRENYIHMRDSVMKINMPGGKAGQYIQTDSMFVEITETSDRDRYMQIARGLWYMENDMMGGPFVSHSMVDEKNGRVIVTEAFVYAPNKKKGSMLRKLEASLYTLKMPVDKMIENSTHIPEVVVEAEGEKTE